MSVKRGGSWCSVYGCRNNSNVNKNISFFRYPRNVERSNAWISATGRRDLLTKGTEYAYKNCRVCALHFLEDMFANDLKNRLHSHAVPKILLSPTEINAAAALAAAEKQAEENAANATNPGLEQIQPTKSVNTSGDKNTSINPELTPLTPVTFYNSPDTSITIKEEPIIREVKQEEDECSSPLDNYLNNTEYNDNIKTYQATDAPNSSETIYIKVEVDENEFDLIQQETSTWDSYYKSLQNYYKLEEQHNLKLNKLHSVIDDNIRNRRTYTKCNVCLKRMLIINLKGHMKTHQVKKEIAD